jgi:hypothetical protein
MQHFEALLGVIMQTSDPRALGLISDLRQDELARSILNRVDVSRFGPAGRGFHTHGEKSSKESSRSARRQSRVTREFVSNEDGGAVLPPPTVEWQDRLCKHLDLHRSRSSPGSGSDTVSSRAGSVSSPESHSISTEGSDHGHQRRRLDSDFPGFSAESETWDGMYTMDASSSDDPAHEDGFKAFGQLSLDGESQEVRFHGKTSGLHLLGRSDRTDHRNEGGVWNLPRVRKWPRARDDVAHLLQEEHDVAMPPMHVQERLVDLYFTYMHPSLPMIHKAQFLADWKAIRNGHDSKGSSKDTSKAKQNVSKLLLLSMFTIAARYLDDVDTVVNNEKENGTAYLADAQKLLNKVYRYSRTSTIQSLLLLGIREFGIGSMEQGWLYMAMAKAMALDLGLNRSTEDWKVGGKSILSPAEMESRKRIWWACCITDKYYAIYMGRNPIIREGDFDTPLPDINQDEETEIWPPPAHQGIDHAPGPALVLSCFRAWASLSIIIGSVADHIYPVKSTSRVPRRTWLARLEAQLDQWYYELPESLRYEPASKRVVPPPHVLRLHTTYWSTVLLLHRAFIPNWKNSSKCSDPFALKAFDLCQTAASRISTAVTSYREKYGLIRASPFLTPALLSAGIMHVVTLSLTPANIQASLGFQQSLLALKDLEKPWPASSRSYDLLQGVKLQFDNLQGFTSSGNQGRNKRPASDAFEKDPLSEVLPREAIGPPIHENKVTAGFGDHVGVQDLSNQLMAHILGLDVNPGVIDSAGSFFPGYRWWPKSPQFSDQGGGIQPSPEGFLGDSWPLDSSYLGMDPSFASYDPQPISVSGFPYVVQPPQEGLVQNNLFYNLQDLM